MALKLAPDARHWWRHWSQRVNAIGLAIMAWLWFDPTALLSVWNMMPVAIRGRFPAQSEAAISVLLFALAMLSRLVCQPKLEKLRQQEKSNG